MKDLNNVGDTKQASRLRHIGLIDLQNCKKASMNSIGISARHYAKLSIAAYWLSSKEN
jgi:hypothetical protein